MGKADNSGMSLADLLVDNEQTFPAQIVTLAGLFFANCFEFGPTVLCFSGFTWTMKTKGKLHNPSNVSIQFQTVSFPRGRTCATNSRPIRYLQNLANRSCGESAGRRRCMEQCVSCQVFAKLRTLDIVMMALQVWRWAVWTSLIRRPPRPSLREAANWAYAYLRAKVNLAKSSYQLHSIASSS